LLWQPILVLNLLYDMCTIATRQLIMEGGFEWSVDRMQIALHIRDVVMATTFWRLMGYNFSCMIASDMLFDSRGRFSGSSYPMKT